MTVHAYMAATFSLALITITLELSASESSGSSSMDAYIWKNRPLLIFAPNCEDQILAAQRSEISSHSEELHERDMIVIEIAADHVTINNQDTPDLKATDLRNRYGVDAGETVVLLVGKDGGVKIRQSHVLSAEALFKTIDAMPMRQREMRERQ